MAAWAEGRAMTLEQAVAYALEETGPKSSFRRLDIIKSPNCALGVLM